MHLFDPQTEKTLDALEVKPQARSLEAQGERPQDLSPFISGSRCPAIATNPLEPPAQRAGVAGQLHVTIAGHLAPGGLAGHSHRPFPVSE